MNKPEFFIQAPSAGTVHLRRTGDDAPRAMDLAKALLKRAAHGGFLPHREAESGCRRTREVQGRCRQYVVWPWP